MRSNAFCKEKFGGIGFDPLNDPMQKLPLTTRKELEQDQLNCPPYGSNLTEPLDHYTRYHQTSGSSGRPMRWLDTPQTWDWFKKCWFLNFRAAGVGNGDRVAFPFSFGPFIGFWAAFESAQSLGCLCIAAGAMTTVARLRLIVENNVQVICCTPTYAMHMAEVANREKINIRDSAVQKLFVAGEPGGNIPETRRVIEDSWNARVFDHSGMTEIGALGFECSERPGGSHLIESECIAEVIDPKTLSPVPDGQPGELVITNLGRTACPVIRYRTGDQVRLSRGKCACGRWFARMEGGILGRIDDMFTVRGNNVFPSGLEALIRRFDEIAEFRVEVVTESALTEVRIDIEPEPGCTNPAFLEAQLAQLIQNTLNFRAEVRSVPPGSLPRFEMKARRFIRRK